MATCISFTDLLHFSEFEFSEKNYDLFFQPSFSASIHNSCPPFPLSPCPLAFSLFSDRLLVSRGVWKHLHHVRHNLPHVHKHCIIIQGQLGASVSQPTLRFAHRKRYMYRYPAFQLYRSHHSCMSRPQNNKN